MAKSSRRSPNSARPDGKSGDSPQSARGPAPVAHAPETPADLVSLPFSPTCCCVDALRLMAQQVTPTSTSGLGGAAKPLDTDDGLIIATTAVAMHALPHTDVNDTIEQFDKLAEAVQCRLTSDNPQAKLAHLHEVIFEEYGFCGNNGDYYNPRNSYLPSVLQSRRGLPIAMAMVYKLVASRIGLRSWGVGLPGHFLAGVECHGPMLVDCFNGGRIIDREDAVKLVRDTAGPEAEFDDTMLRPVTHRHWVTRLIQNLLQIHSSAGNYTDVAAMLEFELVLWPDQLHLQRDLGLVLARIGQPRPAAKWLGGYLGARPEDPQRGDLEELLSVLG